MRPIYRKFATFLSLDKENKRMETMLLPHSPLDYQNLLESIGTFEGKAPRLLEKQFNFFFQ